MKLTWLGDQTWRVYLGGKIVLVHRGAAPAQIDAHEASSGADAIVDLDDNELPDFNPDQVQLVPRRLIDQTNDTELHLSRFAAGLFLVAPDEPPLFLAPGTGAAWGRFADDTVVVLDAERIVEQARAVFAEVRPKLVALAVEDISDRDFAAIAADAGRSAVQMLEPGLALEA